MLGHKRPNGVLVCPTIPRSPVVETQTPGPALTPPPPYSSPLRSRSSDTSTSSAATAETRLGRARIEAWSLYRDDDSVTADAQSTPSPSPLLNSRPLSRLPDIVHSTTSFASSSIHNPDVAPLSSYVPFERHLRSNGRLPGEPTDTVIPNFLSPSITLPVDSSHQVEHEILNVTSTTEAGTGGEPAPVLVETPSPIDKLVELSKPSLSIHPIKRECVALTRDTVAQMGFYSGVMHITMQTSGILSEDMYLLVVGRDAELIKRIVNSQQKGMPAVYGVDVMAPVCATSDVKVQASMEQVMLVAFISCILGMMFMGAIKSCW